MTLIVEDGTGKADAESYISVAEYDAFLASFGYSADSGLDSEKEISLRLTARDLDSEYESSFDGERRYTTQALAFPRYGLYFYGKTYIDVNIIPQGVKWAQAELARRNRNGTTITPDLSNPGIIKRKKIGAGELAQEIEYLGGNSPRTQFTIVENLLRPYLTSGSRVYFA